MIPQTTPDQAKESIDKDNNAIYLDVRSIPEFVQGHPEGAINIPLLHREGGQMLPNPDFASVVQSALPKNKPIFVGCQMGGRSQRACEIMAQLGYENVQNVDGGFGGNQHQKGWKDLGLPVSTDNSEGVSFESLKSRAK